RRCQLGQKEAHAQLPVTAAPLNSLLKQHSPDSRFAQVRGAGAAVLPTRTRSSTSMWRSILGFLPHTVLVGNTATPASA
ncbi:MAG: hypothetical protein WBM36_14005, partial [Lysobacterales bacterium]